MAVHMLVWYAIPRNQNYLEYKNQAYITPTNHPEHTFCNRCILHCQQLSQKNKVQIFLEPHNFQKLEMLNKQASITLNQRKLMSQDLSIESFKVLNLEKLTKFSGDAKLNKCGDE